MITVACVLKMTERRNGIGHAGYSWPWVVKLARGVRKHLDLPHRFVCLTDDLPQVSSEVHVIPLRHGWPGWWSKLELFRPNVFDGPVVYLDLDTIVTGDLRPLLQWGDRFVMAQDFYGGGHCSTAMAWRGDYSGVYHHFRQNSEQVIGDYTARVDGRIGDQAYIEDRLKVEGHDLRTFPLGLVASFKKDARGGKPEGAAVVAFHGRPKCDDPATGWAYEEWSRL